MSTSSFVSTPPFMKVLKTTYCTYHQFWTFRAALALAFGAPDPNQPDRVAVGSPGGPQTGPGCQTRPLAYSHQPFKTVICTKRFVRETAFERFERPLVPAFGAPDPKQHDRVAVGMDVGSPGGPQTGPGCPTRSVVRSNQYFKTQLCSKNWYTETNVQAFLVTSVTHCSYSE